MPSALNFPSNPTNGQQHTVGSRTFSWDGTAWRIYSTPEAPVLTQEEIQDFIAPLFEHSTHSNITASYDDANNKIVLTGTATLTDEQAQDAVAPLLNHSNHSNITALYDDTANKIILTGTATLTDEQAQDAVAPLLNHSNHSNITASYSDETNQIILTAEEAGSTVTVSATAPSSPVEGNIWYNSTIGKLFIYYGTVWAEV